MANTSAAHYETVCVYTVVMHFIDIDNSSEHLSDLYSFLLAISLHSEGSQPLFWHLPVVLTWRGNFSFNALLPHPYSSPSLEGEVCFAKVQLVLLTSKAPVGDSSDQIPL